MPSGKTTRSSMFLSTTTTATPFRTMMRNVDQMSSRTFGARPSVALSFSTMLGLLRSARPMHRSKHLFDEFYRGRSRRRLILIPG